MKKTVLKRLLVVLAVLIMAVGMTACGGSEESPYAGTYVGTTAEYAGIELSMEDLFVGGFDITIENGGKYTITMEGETDGGSWEEVDGVVVLDGEIDFVIDVEAGTGSMDYEGVTLYFEKQ